MQLVTQCDAENRISPDSQLCSLPSSPPLPTQRQPRRKSCRVAKRLLLFLLKSPAALAIAAAPEAREQWSLLSAARPRLWAAAASGRPQQGGRVVPTAPPAPGLGLSQGRQERGGGTILCSRRSQRHIAVRAP